MAIPIGDQAANHYGDTQLDPLEEQLFSTWMRANGLIRKNQKPDEVQPAIDYRGLYRATGGQVYHDNQLFNAVKQFAGQQALIQMLKEKSDNGVDPQEQLRMKQEEHQMKLQMKQEEHQLKMQDRVEERQFKAQERAENQALRRQEMQEQSMLKREQMQQNAAMQRESNAMKQQQLAEQNSMKQEQMVQQSDMKAQQHEQDMAMKQDQADQQMVLKQQQVAIKSEPDSARVTM